MTWRNWSGRHHVDASLHFVRSEADAAAHVRAAVGAGRRLRVAGSGHSHFPLVPTDDVILDVSGLAGLVSADPDAGRARFQAGTPIYAVGAALHRFGLALANQGDIDRQTLAGALATGTHGTGSRLGNLSTSLLGWRQIGIDGEPRWVAADTEWDTFDAGRIGLGAFGVVTEVELAVVASYCLRERQQVSSWEAFADSVVDLPDRHRHFEFFWYPHRDRVIAKTIDVVDAPPVYPLAPEGGRQAWSFEVLPNHRPLKHTEMEYAVPRAVGPACFAALRELVRADFPELRWPIEYRTIAADALWLSQACDQDVVTLSVHQGIDTDDAPLFDACEAIFRSFGGRPHWGKVHSLDATELARVHPRWHDWWRVRDALDPDGVFLNERLAQWRPAAGGA